MTAIIIKTETKDSIVTLFFNAKISINTTIYFLFKLKISNDFLDNEKTTSIYKYKRLL
jgi:hypothetical protein